MFFIRFLLFFVALSITHLQADDFSKGLSHNHRDSKIDDVTPSPHNASRLVALAAIQKEKQSQSSADLQEQQCQSSCDDDQQKKPSLRKSYKFSIVLPSAQFESFKNIAIKFKDNAIFNTCIIMQKKFKNFMNEFQQSDEYLLLINGIENEYQKEEDDLSLFIHQKRRSGTTETRDSSGDREVVHEHSADTPEGKVDFIVVAQYEQHDTIEICTSIDVGISHSQNEPKDSPSTPDKEPEQRNEPRESYSYDRSGFDDHIKDSAMNREREMNESGDQMDTSPSSSSSRSPSPSSSSSCPPSSSSDTPPSPSITPDTSSNANSDTSGRYTPYDDSEEGRAEKQKKDEEDEDEVRKKYDDDETSKRYDEDRKNEEDEARARVVKKRKEKLEKNKADVLAAYGYIFTPSEKTKQDLEKAQKAIDDENKNATILTSISGMFFTSAAIQAQKAAQENIKTEQKTWETNSLKEIEEKENTQRTQRSQKLKEDRIKVKAKKAFQWGDNFPITQGFFNYIGWRSQSQTRRRQLLAEQEKWLQNNGVGNASQEDKNMIRSMLDAMVDAKNDTDIELAQAGLESWKKAKQAQSDKQRAYHAQKAKDYYDAVQFNTPQPSIGQQTPPIKPGEIDNLLKTYQAAIQEYHQEEKSCNRQPSNNPFLDRMEKRAQALAESQEQQKSQNLPHHTYDLSPQARGFMMANNMNYAAFDGAKVTNYQHCLTQEILGIIESSAGAALKYNATSMIGQLAEYNCNLAVSAQQLNQLADIQQATAITNIAHFFDAYGKLLVDSGLHSQTTIDIGLGVIDGTAQSLQKWKTFLQDLGCQPGQTIGKIADDCKAIGTGLLKIGAKIGEFTPLAYHDDMMKDMQNDLNRIKNGNKTASDQNSKTSMMLRTERNAQSLKDGLYGAIKTAEVVIDGMMKKSTRENVAGATEIAINTVITGKIADSLLHIAQIIGNPIVQAAENLIDNIPPRLINSPFELIPGNTGELIAIVQGTGENIGAAAAAQKAANDAAQFLKNAARIKAAVDTAKNGSGNNKEKNKPKAEAADPHTYENGKYKGSDKHHANSPDDIGKPPRDGQKALDDSFAVQGSTQRVTVQDGKVVILKYEGQGVYHGYIDNNIISLDQDVKEALIKHGFLKDGKSKKLI